MRAIGKHTLLPVALILIGLGQLIYGVGFHSQPVLTEQQAEQEFVPPPPFLRGDPDQPLFLQPPPPPPAEPVLVALDESEPELIREVTVGGVARLESGELKRTYSGAPPSLCPT